MRRPKIMIVDGHANDHVYELIVSSIRDVVDVALFDDPSLALRAARYKKFDLLVIGHDLPVIEVSEFISQIRQLPDQEMVHVALRNDWLTRPNNERSKMSDLVPINFTLHIEISASDLLNLTALLR